MKANYIRILGAGLSLVSLAGLSYVWAGGLLSGKPTPPEDVASKPSNVPQSSSTVALADMKTSEGYFPGMENLIPGQILEDTPPDVLEPDDDGSSFAFGIGGVRTFTPNLDFQFRSNSVASNEVLPADATPPLLPGQTLAGSPPDEVDQQGIPPNLDFQFRCNKRSGEMKPSDSTETAQP